MASNRSIRIGALDRRYAKALYMASGESLDICSQWEKSFSRVHELFEMAEARNILKSPVMPKDLKLQLLELAVGKDDGKLSAFFSEIIENGRVDHLLSVIAAFSELLSKLNGVMDLEVVSAVPVPESILSNAAASLGTNIKFRVHNRVDPSIVGGVVLKYGNNVVDMSVASQLNKLTANLVNQ